MIRVSPVQRISWMLNLSMTKKNKTLVLGVGNPLRRDDMLGLHLIRELQQGSSFPNIDLREGPFDGLTLLDEMQEYARVLLIDAVDMHAEPGAIRLFTPLEVKQYIRRDTLSTHGFGLAEVIQLMDALGLSPDLKILGIQPKNIEFGEGLSPEIECKMGVALQKIREILSAWAPE